MLFNLDTMVIEFFWHDAIPLLASISFDKWAAPKGRVVKDTNI